MSRGQLMIVVVVGLALAAAGFSGVWRYLQTHRSLDFWGPEAAQLIAHAEKVEAIRFEPDHVGSNEPDAAFFVVDGQRLAITESEDVTRARGFTNARQALLLDRSFRWTEIPPCTPTWSHGLRYSRGQNSVTVLFSFDCQFARTGDQSATVSIAPIAEGLEQLLAEQVGS